MCTLPLERIYDLSDVPDGGYELDVDPGTEELNALAKWSGVNEVLKLHAHIFVRAQSKTRFLEEATFEADIVQSCVVTLEPVRTHIARKFVRALHLMPDLQRFADKGGSVSATAVAEDSPDEIDNSVYDLGTPLREEFVLGIDPYPRAPGVAFKTPKDDDHAESPFAVLERLKRAP